MADGTASSPIVFTSQAALLNPANADVAQWGGLTVLGDATTNHTNPFYEVDQTNTDFAFGGTNATDNSGVLRNVYILNSGKVIGTDIEINGLSLAGVGSGTTVENIYVENSADDCIEIWGGSVNVTNATMVNCQDDGFDLDYGYTGTATNIVVQQTKPFFAGFEISSGGDSPMTSPKIVNFTINKVAGASEGGIYIKDDTTAPTFINGEVTTLDDADAGIHTKKVFTAAQSSAIAFK
ncbi:MAG: right-handed parallel beta-helix repeat-containing protein, partial [Campylobacterales bacterium]|nr:right-handed parallel beta-helix repeat-containing protein [Campylobacterales bacterium]